MNTMMALSILPACASMGDIEDLRDTESSFCRESLPASANNYSSVLMNDICMFRLSSDVLNSCRKTDKKASCHSMTELSKP